MSNDGVLPMTGSQNVVDTARATAESEALPFTIQDLPGRGKGLVACVDISRGTRILSETPLFTTQNLKDPVVMENTVATKLRALSREDQRRVLSLHNNFAGKFPLSGIVRTNALPCGSNAPIGGLYATICLINHSCLGNAHQNWNADLRQETIHAVRDIKNGEEITIRYDRGGPSETRRKSLKENFGFQCDCVICTLESNALNESDSRRREMDRLDNEIGDPRRVMSCPKDCLSDCRQLLEKTIIEYQGTGHALLARLYYDAFQIAVTHGDLARATVYADRAYQSRVVCEGADSPETKKLKALKLKPTNHMSYGVSREWTRSAKKVPKNLTEEEFEEWLWMVRR